MTGASPIDGAWKDHRRVWAGPLRGRNLFGAGFTAGYRSALEREPLRVQLDADELARLGLAVLTPDEVDVVAPALLEAGTRHLERPGTALQELGRRLHSIAERLYEAANCTPTKKPA
jgi:hypothetical protein